MRDALEKAGLNSSQSDLYMAAIEVLRQERCSAALAVEPFLEQVRKSPALILELMGITERQMRERAMAYLRERADEMSKRIGGASQIGGDSQVMTVRPSDQDARASQAAPESHGRHEDRPSSQTDGCHPELGSRRANERPVGVAQERPDSLPARPPKGQRATIHQAPLLTPRGVLASAANSIFARRLEFGLTIGDATYLDIETAEKKGYIWQQFFGALKHRLPWSPNPDIRTHQRVMDIATEKQVQEIFDETYRVLDAVGITNARHDARP